MIVRHPIASLCLVFPLLLTAPASARSITNGTASANHNTYNPFQQTEFKIVSGIITLDAGDAIVTDSVQIEIDGALRDTAPSVGGGNPATFNASTMELHHGVNHNLRAKVTIDPAVGPNFDMFATSAAVVNCGH